MSLVECITEHCIASLLLQSDNIGLNGYCSPVVFTMDLINNFSYEFSVLPVRFFENKNPSGVSIVYNNVLQTV